MSILASEQRDILDLSAKGMRSAWSDQWDMMEEDVELIAAEYLLTVSVARSLAQHESFHGRVRLEHSIEKLFRNGIMKLFYKIRSLRPFGKCRIDVVLLDKRSMLSPLCLIELKRDFIKEKIKQDAERIAYLIKETKDKLPDLFGVCLFPLSLKADINNRCAKNNSPVSYGHSEKIAKNDVSNLVTDLSREHSDLDIRKEYYNNSQFERPSVTFEDHDDGTVEGVVDSDGFLMLPTAIIIQKKQSDC